MIPIALLITHHWPSFKRKKSVLYVAVCLPVLLIGAYFLEPTKKLLSNNTDKTLVLHPEVNSSELYAFPFKSYSSQFYSKGKIKIITRDALEKMVEDSTSFSIIIKKRQPEYLSSKVMSKLKLLMDRRKDGLYQYK